MLHSHILMIDFNTLSEIHIATFFCACVYIVFIVLFVCYVFISLFINRFFFFRVDDIQAAKLSNYKLFFVALLVDSVLLLLFFGTSNSIISAPKKIFCSRSIKTHIIIFFVHLYRICEWKCAMAIPDVFVVRHRNVTTHPFSTCDTNTVIIDR